MPDAHADTKPMTLRRLLHKVAEGHVISMLTCYDATTAGWLQRAGVDALLVGDSAAQVILGFDSSIHAPLDFMIHITAAVKRGAPDCLIVGDMPFMSYQADDAEAIRNAGRFLTEGRADVVKLEVDDRFAELVGKMSRAGIPVIAHIGWQPQRAVQAGVRTALIAGRTAAEVRRLVEQAEILEGKGAVMLLMEQCPAEAAEAVVQAVKIPVIGCGAGPACHGQVVVLQDLLGMTTGRRPSFVGPTGDVGKAIEQAARKWVKQVQTRAYPASHPYAMDPGEADKLRRD